jgi:hypothetical protein
MRRRNIFTAMPAKKMPLQQRCLAALLDALNALHDGLFLLLARQGGALFLLNSLSSYICLFC